MGEPHIEEVYSLQISNGQGNDDLGIRMAEVRALRTAISGDASEAENAMLKLVGMLGDPSPLVRRAVLGALDYDRFPWACEKIASCLAVDPDEGVRILAAARLSTCSATGALKHLILALHDPSPQVRGTAANSIGRIGDPNTAKELTLLLSDESSFARVEACKALLDIGVSNREVIESLESLRYDPIAQKLETVKQRGREHIASHPEWRSLASRTAYCSLDDLLRIARDLQVST